MPNARLKIVSPSELVFESGDGLSYPIHPLWLRERCQDAASMDRITQQRLSDPSDLPLDLKVASVSAAGGGQLTVRFSDGHEAQFKEGDLLREASLPPGQHDVPPTVTWDATLRELPKVRWSANPDRAELADWLRHFLTYGFIILQGVPSERGQVLKVGAQFGFTRETNFGALFDVRSTPSASDLAYTSVHLDPHTDNPYRSPVPGIQLLHCLINETTGGLSTLVDGFAVADALRREDPAAFKILSETPVRFRYQDPSTELTASAPPIELDVTGAVRTIHFSPRLDFVPLMPPDRLSAYYRARRAFDHRLRGNEFQIEFLLQSGDLVMFDNCRLLHGRTRFNPAEGLRHLQGCYIDIDGPRSLYRVLRRQE
jgi:gamma-butyrobetaine dioxygenase